MKIEKWYRLMSIVILFIVQPVYGAIITDMNGQKIEIEETYIDTSHYAMPYKATYGFLVSPLQQVSEVIAPFNQSRIGYVHEGIDLRAEEGTPIFAIADGIVTKAAPDSKGVENGGGHMIFIDFGQGTEGRYMHLSAYGVQQGDYVRAGQVIGFTGNTGDSLTPHLHFEYRINGILVDPTFIFEMSDMILKQEKINSMTDIQETLEATYSSMIQSNSSNEWNWQKGNFAVIQE